MHKEIASLRDEIKAAEERFDTNLTKSIYSKSVHAPTVEDQEVQVSFETDLKPMTFDILSQTDRVETHNAEAQTGKRDEKSEETQTDINLAKMNDLEESADHTEHALDFVEGLEHIEAGGKATPKRDSKRTSGKPSVKPRPRYYTSMPPRSQPAKDAATEMAIRAEQAHDAADGAGAVEFILPASIKDIGTQIEYSQTNSTLFSNDETVAATRFREMDE